MTTKHYYRLIDGEKKWFGFDSAATVPDDLTEATQDEVDALRQSSLRAQVFICSKLQGELALLEEPSPTPDHPTMLHWVETTVDAENDPIRRRAMQAYLNAPTWRSDDPLVPTMWQAAGRDLEDLPALFTKAQGL